MTSARAIYRLLCLIVLLAGGAVSAGAQAIPTPYGELRLGMTKEQLVDLFHANLKELKDPDGKIYARRVSDLSNARSFYIFLTTQEVVYSMLSIEYKSGDVVGNRAAEDAFYRYIGLYVAPNNIGFDQAGEALRKIWKTDEGLTYEILLGCHRTEVMVKISDYARRLRDDDIDEENKVSFDGWSAGYACFF